MIQTSEKLEGKAQDAVTLWSYDNRYRLTNETVIVDAMPSSRTLSTAYT